MRRLVFLTASIAISAILLPRRGNADAPNSPADNAELQRMFEEDQADRKAGMHGIDWSLVKPRDDARLKRTRELYATDALRTGADWFHAALILQHSSDPVPVERSRQAGDPSHGRQGHGRTEAGDRPPPSGRDGAAGDKP